MATTLFFDNIHKICNMGNVCLLLFHFKVLNDGAFKRSVCLLKQTSPTFGINSDW